MSFTVADNYDLKSKKLKPIYTKNRTVGILGGSFNPAHLGHLYISEYALKKLGIDEIWWLVSPHNPLKDKNTLADYNHRLKSARNITSSNRNIYVSDVENRLKLKYTYKTIVTLKKSYHGTNFIWLMGADNLAGFHKWQNWQDILRLVPVIVFDRSPYSFSSLKSKTYIKMKRFLLNDSGIIARRTAPTLHFVHLKRSPYSSTDIRKTLGIFTNLGHNKLIN